MFRAPYDVILNILERPAIVSLAVFPPTRFMANNSRSLSSRVDREPRRRTADGRDDTPGICGVASTTGCKTMPFITGVVQSVGWTARSECAPLFSVWIVEVGGRRREGSFNPISRLSGLAGSFFDRDRRVSSPLVRNKVAGEG